MKLSDKNEFIFLDYSRVIFAFMIMVLHFKPFSEVNAYVDYYFSGVITRLGVPYFFLLSGFFLKDTPEKPEKAVKYLLRLVKLFFVYTALYIPQHILIYRYAGITPINALWLFTKANVLEGSYAQLWYFKGLFVAVLMLFVFRKLLKFNDKVLLAVALVLYFVCIGKGPYEGIITQNPFFYRFFAMVSMLFPSARNGVLLGFPLLCTGYLISRHKELFYKKSYCIFAIVFVALLLGEGYILNNIICSGGQDVLLLMAPCVAFLFLMFAFIPIDESKKPVGLHLRKLSVLIFGIHPLCHFYVTFFFNNIKGIFYSNLVSFFLVTAVTFISAEIVIYLTKFRYFKFLNMFF